MWIVSIALRRPYTFLVMALIIVLATPYMLLTMATDILPEINIPVISIIWSYSGLSAQEMGYRITGPSERILTTTVNNIEHIESQSLPGVAVVKIFLQRGANLETAMAQTVATEQFMIKQHAAGHDAADRADLFGLLNSGRSTRAVEQYAAGTGGQRRGDEQSAAATGDHSGRGRFPPPMAASSASSRWTSTPRRCSPRGCRRSTSSTRSTPRT